ncbi:MAG: CDP-alcohol phosphatidyltransferase family protein [Anaerolineales bacterium]|jgi:CDP-diacylglycerol--glycerol-3-phosphate 3-phosphatidyltransferase
MQSENPAKETRLTFTEWLRNRFRGVLDPIGRFLNRLGLYPNTLTLVGLSGNLAASVLIARGEFLIGGLIGLAMGPIDALDGTMARLRGEASEFGAFVDSISDRYSELIILGGMLAHYLLVGDALYAGITYLAASGSVLVSYTKARAESLGYQAKGGILTRVERYLVIMPSLILGYPQVGVAIIALLANVTALQRIYFVRRQARRK